MPNHVSNRVFFKSHSGDEDKDYTAVESALEQLTALMKTDKHPFDFNVLFPYPEEWEKADEAHHEAMKAGVAWQDLPPDGYNRGGHEWCRDHWGTKWNAYDISFDYDAIYFNTAWATPLPIWEELSKRFPDLQLVVEYADENKGSNCGVLTYQGGELVSETSCKTMPDPVLFARAIIAEQREGEYQRDLHEAEERIKELEAEIKRLTAGDTEQPPSAS